MRRTVSKKWSRFMSQPTVPGLEPAPTKNQKFVNWVRDVAALTQPDRVVWCDGSQAEWDRLAWPAITLRWTPKA
jgi:GTP-dependent phosphoenolpyruvate carboxykinase